MGDPVLMVVCFLIHGQQRCKAAYRMTRQPFSRIALPAPDGEAPTKGGVNIACPFRHPGWLSAVSGAPSSAELEKEKFTTFVSWNVRTLQDSQSTLERRTAVVNRILNQYNVDIAALQESRFVGQGQLRERQYTFYWKTDINRE